MEVAWYDPNWNVRKKITISQIETSTAYWIDIYATSVDTVALSINGCVCTDEGAYWRIFCDTGLDKDENRSRVFKTLFYETDGQTDPNGVTGLIELRSCSTDDINHKVRYSHYYYNISEYWGPTIECYADLDSAADIRCQVKAYFWHTYTSTASWSVPLGTVWYSGQDLDEDEFLTSTWRSSTGVAAQIWRATGGCGSGNAIGDNKVITIYPVARTMTVTKFDLGNLDEGPDFTISGTLAGGTIVDQTDYQVAFIVNYDSNMRSDFGDLRFTKDDGTTPVNYWIEKYTASTSATVWIKLDTLPASGSTDIYMYYANPSASDIGDGNNVFILFDHFDGTSLDTDKWVSNVFDTQTTISVSGGNLIINSVYPGTGGNNCTGGCIVSKNPVNGITNQLTVEARVMSTNVSDSAQGQHTGLTDSNTAFEPSYYGTPLHYACGGLYYMASPPRYRYVGMYDGTTSERTFYEIFDDYRNIIQRTTVKYDYANRDMWLTTIGEGATTVNISVDGSLSNVIPNYGFVASGIGGLVGNSTIYYCDWVAFRKFSIVDPTSVFGVAQSRKDIGSTAKIITTYQAMLISIARIKETIEKNISCSGRIKITDYQNIISSSGRILKQYSNDLTSASRIKMISENTIVSDSRLIFKQLYQVDSTARISTTFMPYLISDSRLRILDIEKNIDNETRIKIAFNQNNIDSNSRIIKPTSDIITSNSAVRIFGIQRNILSDSRLLKSFSDVIDSNAKINMIFQNHITSNSRIIKEFYNQIINEARIKTINTDDIDLESRIKIFYDYDIFSNARIIAVKTELIDSNSKIKKQFDTSINSDSRIKIIYSDDIFSTARVMTTELYLLTSNSRIKKDFQKSIQNNAMISMIFAEQLDFNARIATPLGFVRGERWFKKL